ncbi:hypothetical protein B0H14DRAFT_3512197 [Mycena olivaceomarginata]|nr:hypothetical protein B0H14DRAFT_3512197 [Mycena olivaceomarginata]
MATHTAIVDDRDPLIQYGGSWVPGGVPVEFDSTTMTTVDAGSTATFSFIGTSVTVYATGRFEDFGDPAHLVILLWTSSASPLQNGPHTLVITQSQAASGSNKIKYTPAWRQFGSDGDFEHNLPGDFVGKSIAFYGGVTSETANASITIDGGPPKFWLPPVGATTNNLIFDSGDLSPGEPHPGRHRRE